MPTRKSRQVLLQKKISHEEIPHFDSTQIMKRGGSIQYESSLQGASTRKLKRTFIQKAITNLQRNNQSACDLQMLRCTTSPGLTKLPRINESPLGAFQSSIKLPKNKQNNVHTTFISEKEELFKRA